MRWDHIETNRTYISFWPHAEIPLVKILKPFVNLARENTCMPEAPERQVEAPESSEKVDEAHIGSGPQSLGMPIKRVSTSPFNRRAIRAA